MFVRQLIGRQAGEIVELPFHVGDANVISGISAHVTEEEIAAAGLLPSQPSLYVRPDEMPGGYRAVSAEGGGFDVMDAGGVVINKEFIPNLAAARSFAIDLLVPVLPVVEEDTSTIGKLNKAELLLLAADSGVDVSGAKTKAEIVVLLNDAAATKVAAEAAAKAAAEAANQGLGGGANSGAGEGLQGADAGLGGGSAS